MNQEKKRNESVWVWILLILGVAVSAVCITTDFRYATVIDVNNRIHEYEVKFHGEQP